jgi:hypothetical protein
LEHLRTDIVRYRLRVRRTSGIHRRRRTSLHTSKSARLVWHYGLRVPLRFLDAPDAWTFVPLIDWIAALFPLSVVGNRLATLLKDVVSGNSSAQKTPKDCVNVEAR